MTFNELKRLIMDAGACSFGVSSLRPVEQSVFDDYRQWLADGKHGGMTYLENNLEIRRNPALLLTDGTDPQPGGTIISVAFPYFCGIPYHGGKLKFARYALGDDYHEVLRNRLRPVAGRIAAETGCEARICVDTAPILERYWATQAGIGFIGKNRQLIIPGIGSHIFLAEIVTRAEFAEENRAEVEGASLSDTSSSSDSAFVSAPELRLFDACLNCNACQRVCPQGALSGEGFDARRCNSYLTIEHRGELPEGVSLRDGRIYGCDLCLEACPMAKPAFWVKSTPVAATDSPDSNGEGPELRNNPFDSNGEGPEDARLKRGFVIADAEIELNEFSPRATLLNLTIEDLQQLTPEAYSQLFRHSPIKRAKLAGLLRNASRLI